MGYGNATYSADLKVIREVKYNILKCLCSNTYMKKNHFIMFEYMYLNITYNLKNVLVLFTVFLHLEKWFFFAKHPCTAPLHVSFPPACCHGNPIRYAVV